MRRAGAVLALVAAGAAGTASGAPAAAPAAPDDPIAKYFTELEAMKLIDTESGNLDTLRRELGTAELLLRDGAFSSAAVALYAIVKSPRYAAFTDFVEYQNAEYDLGVALARAGSYGAALDALEVVIRRGPAGVGATTCSSVGFVSSSHSSSRLESVCRTTSPSHSIRSVRSSFTLSGGTVCRSALYASLRYRRTMPSERARP